jgi:hypothetical protein
MWLCGDSDRAAQALLALLEKTNADYATAEDRKARLSSQAELLDLVHRLVRTERRRRRFLP